MRNGRPCSCGCATCYGFGCASGVASTGCNSVLTYGFVDNFSTVNSGWIYDRFTATDGVGVPVSGGYVFDAVSGVNFTDYDCTTITGSTTFYYESVNGYGSISIDNLTLTASTDGSVSASLPNGSGVTLSTSFRSGDNLLFRVISERVPPDYKRQFISLYRLSRNNGCSSPESTSDYPADPGGSESSGCPFYSCLLYKGLFSEVPEDSGITVADPFLGESYVYKDNETVNVLQNFIVAESGGLNIDDACFQGQKSERPEGFVYFTSESCGRYLRPQYWAWDYPCTKFFGPYDPTHSGINEIYLTFRAFANGHIGCDLDPPDSGDYSHLRVHVKEYDVDLLEPDIFRIIPIGAKQTLYPLTDTTPMDGSGGPNYYINYSGIPCRAGYSPPFFNYENSIPYCYGSSFSPNKGNLTNVYDSGVFDYLQAGTDDFFHPTIEVTDLPLDTSSQNIDLDPIPREDLYGRPNYYVTAGDLAVEAGTSGDIFWTVDKRAYTINWDSAKQYWYGEFQFLSASGGGDTSALNASNDFQGFDFSIPFTSGQATQVLDFYLQQECGGGNSRTYLIDSSGNYYGGNDDLFSSTRYGYPVSTALCSNGTSFLFTGHCSLPYDSDGQPHVFGSPQIIYEKEILCDNCSGCSGVLTYGLNTLCGYYLDATDFTSGVPPVFIDTKGYAVLRVIDHDRLGGNAACGSVGFTQIFHNSSMGGGLICPSVLDNHAIYELGPGDAITLSYPRSESKTLLDMAPIEGGPACMLPIYAGYVNGNIRESGDASPNETNVISYLILFADYQNDKWRAFLRPVQDCNDGLTYPFYYGGGATSTSDRYEGVYKYEQDFLDDTYFADIEVLSSSPMRLKITQQFTTWLYFEGDDCEVYTKTPLYCETIIEEPTTGIK